MSSFGESRQRAIALIEKLPRNKLPAVVEILERMASSAEQSNSENRERELLAIIDRALPEAVQEKLHSLRDRAQQNKLNKVEQAELLAFEDRQEQLQANRLSALVELANLRGTDLITLNREIQSSSQTHSSATQP